MEKLLEQVERAQRRMLRNTFFSHLIGWLFCTLVVAAVAVAAPKVVAIDGLPTRWAEAWLIGAAAVALVGAGVTTHLRRGGQLDAAVEIDRRFGLRERVASSLSLPESEHASEMGRALISDASRSVERVDVAEAFKLNAGRRAWLPVLPAAAAFALMTLVGDRQQAGATAQQPPAAAQKQVKQSLEELRKKIAKKIQEGAAKEELQDASKLLKEIDRGVEEVTKKDGASRKDATVKLNDLAKQLEQRQKELGGSQALKKELEKLKNLGRGPAEKAAEALKQGDWDKALKEIADLQKQLAKGGLKPEQQKQLAEQLGKIKQQLDAAAEAREQAINDLKKKIEEQKRKGNLAEAGKLEQQLDRMQQQQAQANKLQQLAEQLGQAQQAAQQGDQQAAADALNQMAEQLEQMQQEIDQMEMLADAMDQIEAAKQAMGCQQCQGNGCQGCQGEGFGQGFGKGQGQGNGMGEGRGSGPRPDEKNPTGTRDTRVRQNPGRGDSTFGGLVKGPNTRGDVRQSLKDSLAADNAAEAEALDEQRLPKSQREHARQYFERLREEL